MSAEPKALAAAYFEAWQTADVQRLRSILADDVSRRVQAGLAGGVAALYPQFA